MGTVYEGHDPGLDRRVAIKILTLDDMSDEESRGRFEREARAAAKLQHPNIITIYELGNFGRKGKPYIVMEYLEGTDLVTLIGPDKRIPFAEALEITIQLASGLDFAHQHGVVHRDVKPSNIRCLDDGRVKIMDFGIARVEGSAQITRSGVLVGTLHYMSPEQIKGEPIDGRSDVFSSGCILYEMLAGKRPFQGESTTAVLYNIVNEQARSILEVNADLPQETQEILERALTKEAGDRFQTAGQMAAELEKLLDVYRKSFPRPSADIQRRLDELERLSREERWSELMPLAQQLVSERPDLDLPQRMLRRAVREISRQETERLETAEERTRSLAEISEELRQFCDPLDRPVAVHEAGAPDSIPETGVSPGGVGIRPSVKLAAAVLVVASLAVAGWLWLRPREVAIQISSDPPGASIFVNGQDSAVVTRAAGPVEILVQGRAGDELTVELHHAGYESVRESLTLGSEPPPPLELALAPLPRKLEVVTDPPGATVHLDGEELAGTTPLDVTLTARQEHVLVVSKEEFESRRVTIAPGGELPSEVLVLRPLTKPGTLAVKSTYPVSVLSAGGQGLVGATENASVEMGVGRHQIVLRAPEVFLNRTVSIEIREAKTTFLETPPLGKVYIRASPENCTLTVNGLPAESPPFNNKDIVCGPSTFVFEWPDGRRDEQTYSVEPGRPTYVTGQIR